MFCIIYLLSGDFWYPKDIDQSSTITDIKIPVSYDSITNNCTIEPCNHSARFGTPNMTCISTNILPYGQVNPAFFSATDKISSHL